MMGDGTTPDLAEVISLGVDEALEGTHTAIVCTVLEYNAVDQTATIQPAVSAWQRDIALPVAMPALSGVPVAFPTGGGYTITWPLLPGDPVVAVCLEHDLDAWIALGQPSALPNTRRRFSLSDAVCFPGPRPRSNPRAATAGGGMSMGLDTGVSEVRVQATEVVVTSPTVKLGSAAASAPVSLSTLVDAIFSGSLATWAAAVETALAGAGSPIGTPYAVTVGTPSTGAAKVKAE